MANRAKLLSLARIHRIARGEFPNKSIWIEHIPGAMEIRINMRREGMWYRLLSLDSSVREMPVEVFNRVVIDGIRRYYYVYSLRRRVSQIVRG